MWNLRRYFAIPLTAFFLIPGSFAQKPADDHALSVMVGKALIIDSDADILRVAVAGSQLAETVAINPREILVNGLLPGETSHFVVAFLPAPDAAVGVLVTFAAG